MLEILNLQALQDWQQHVILEFVGNDVSVGRGAKAMVH
jgi:hypothetical protein